MMEIVEVKERVVAIGEAQNDPERAHGLEDSLYLELLEAIANGTCENVRACAAEAIKTRAFDFPRWCA